jgi:dinuclear metal center YbgI/SA1388 family protein
MEELAPKSIAVPEDKIGLQLGSLAREIRTVLVALDVTEEVVDEAIRLGAELIIAHHAIIYRPLAQLQTDTPMGNIYAKLIKHDIAVYIAHTNLDAAEGGMNDWMAEALQIQPEGVLEEVSAEKLYKLVVFVPYEQHQRVLDAMFASGAGWIGNYSHCSFNVRGQGTFLPREGAQPFIGQPGKMEIAEEVRVETIVPESAKNRVIQSMLKAHPYEEVAYDVYQLERKGRVCGLGRVGRLNEPTTLSELAQRVKTAFQVPMVRVVGEPDREIRKAAVLGGSGGRYYRHALRAGADVLITGDIDYHTAHDALAAGISLIDPGHNAEKIMKRKTAEWLERKLSERKYDTKVMASTVNTEVFRFV